MRGCPALSSQLCPIAVGGAVDCAHLHVAQGLDLCECRMCCSQMTTSSREMPTRTCSRTCSGYAALHLHMPDVPGAMPTLLAPPSDAADIVVGCRRS